MYLSLIRPTLEYSDVVWDNCSEYLKQELESVQVEAARICTGATKYCNIQKLLNDIKWDTLSERRKQHRLLLFYKMAHGLSPPYMSDLITHINQTQSGGYNLRHIRHARARTQAYSLSFLPKTIREWNQLHITIQNSPDVQSFKNALQKEKNKSSPLFYCGSRTGQILHTRLRLDCSGLNHDLYRRSLVSSPLCSCGSSETIEHFLLRCPHYTNLRTHCFADIRCPITTNNLLNGFDRFSLAENELLFRAVQRYIIATKRFATYV
jgi:hypothetical protein